MKKLICVVLFSLASSNAISQTWEQFISDVKKAVFYTGQCIEYHQGNAELEPSCHKMYEYTDKINQSLDNSDIVNGEDKISLVDQMYLELFYYNIKKLNTIATDNKKK